VQPALGSEDANWRASTHAAESGTGDGKAIVMSTNDVAAIAVEPSDLLPPKFSPDELLGQTHLKDKKMDSGQGQGLTEDHGHRCRKPSRH
jgi:hypothetical protein